MTDTEQQTSSPERFTLRKSAKLRHRTLVQELFQKGRSVYSGPLRITFRALSKDELEGSFREAVPDLMGPVQFMITVPKKKRRHAVDRVLMRRRIREALRLQWHPLKDIIQSDPAIR
ncbi:MAG: ribonuclease P protein component, partial [Muribaculaceae bacterium]|nr:ribonuclease P protein component [Muribaculaceae bacterium]